MFGYNPSADGQRCVRTNPIPTIGNNTTLNGSNGTSTINSTLNEITTNNGTVPTTATIKTTITITGLNQTIDPETQPTYNPGNDLPTVMINAL